LAGGSVKAKTRQKSLLSTTVLGNRKVRSGLVGMLALTAFILAGYPFSLSGLREDVRPAYLAPSLQYPLGTDQFGRSMFSVVIVGALHSFEIGFLTAVLGTMISVVVGLVAGYYSGRWVDTLLSETSRFFLVIPAFALLILVFSLVRFVTVYLLALLIALLSWPFATFVIRAQTLQLREAEFVNLAKCSGLPGSKIIFQELLPNLIPYIGANFTNLFTWAILYEMGISVIGLPPNQVTLGTTLYWAIVDDALLRNLWWLWVPSTVIYILMFIFLYYISTGLDEAANPRLKEVTGM